MDDADTLVDGGYELMPALRAGSGVGPDSVAHELAQPRATPPAASRGGGVWPFRGVGLPVPWRQGRTVSGEGGESVFCFFGGRWTAREIPRALPFQPDRPPPPRPPPQVLDRPDVCITVASSFPDRIRLLKRVSLFPLSLTLRADYVRATRSFDLGCSARDAVLGGDVRLDAGGRSLNYYKRVPLGPSGAHVAVLGGVSLAGALRGDFSQTALKPSLAFRYELGGGGAVWSGERVDLRHRVALGKRLGLEARGSARLPAPRAEVTLGGGGRRTASGRLEGAGGRVSLGDGGPLCLHVEEVNAILWL